MGQETLHRADADEYEAEEYAAQPAREKSPPCSHCGVPLRTAREQSAKLCSWCEESVLQA